MTVIDGDILRISANFELGDGTLYQNIYHYVRDGPDPISDEAHITAISAQMNAIYATLTSMVKDDVVARLSFVDEVQFDEIADEWRVVQNIGTFTVDFSPTGSEDALPFMSAPYVIFKTQRPRSVGKKFLFPFLETMQDSTILVGGAVTAIVAFGAAVLGVVQLGGTSTLTSGIVRTGIQSFLLFLVAVVRDIIGSQRRRRPGVGA